MQHHGPGFKEKWHYTVRFCTDLKYLNAMSQFAIDLCKGYWQVSLTQRPQELTALRTPWGLFQFTVLPFGLYDALVTFQRLIDQVLCDLSDFASAYLDDIVIYSATLEEHLEHIRRVLKHLKSTGLTINTCAFAKTD